MNLSRVVEVFEKKKNYNVKKFNMNLNAQKKEIQKLQDIKVRMEKVYLFY